MIQSHKIRVMLGDYDRAFACLAQANAIHRAGLCFDIAATERRMAAIADN